MNIRIINYETDKIQNLCKYPPPPPSSELEEIVSCLHTSVKRRHTLCKTS